jgi:CheY-like chemotaxis protein
MALSVLTAESDPAVRADVRAVLETAGLMVCAAASDGLEAVRLARHHEPDVILLDAQLPRLDSAEAVRRIRNEQDVPIVLLADQAAEEHVGRALQAGAASWMRKPYRRDELPALLVDAFVAHCTDALRSQRAESRAVIVTVLRSLGYPQDWAYEIEERCFRAGRVWHAGRR